MFNAKGAASGDLADEDDAYRAVMQNGPLDLNSIVGGIHHTEHADDAIDFEDFDELADEEEPSVNDTHGDIFAGLDNDRDQVPDDGFGDLGGGQLGEETEAQDRDKMLKYYPTFAPGKVLKQTEFSGYVKQDYRWHKHYFPRKIRPLIPLKPKLEVELDQKKAFKSGKPLVVTSFNPRVEQRLIKVSVDQDDEDEKNDNRVDEVLPLDYFLATEDWDYELLLGGAEGERASKRLKSAVPEDSMDWNWNDEEIISGKVPLHLALDMNDCKLLFLADSTVGEKRNNTRRAVAPDSDRSLLAKFSISNDKHYDKLKENYHSKIRATISTLNIEHAQPAIKLQWPFYKVNLDKEQVRHFHRRNFGAGIRPGTNIVFSKLKLVKKKKIKNKEVREIYGKSKDLTLGDTSQVFLMEYSEQQPIALSKFGMSSKLINYYRQKSEEDTSRPKLPVGETQLLGVQDRSPFWNFGMVEHGQVVPTLYNNMIRAPIFKQEVAQTDFLLVKSSGYGSGNRFYLRPITHTFVVGQTFPVVEIPGPNSRKVSQVSKNRLKMVVHRILNKNPGHRLVVKDIASHFPDQNDMQNRQRLKEFMMYQREGVDQGFWKLKEGDALLNMESVQKLISPEDIAILESMYAGQQYVDDSLLYYVNFNKIKAEEPLEEQLAPWNVTKNFLNAAQMRAMVQIKGEGDPTTRGEGFSFLKTSMKGGFKSLSDENNNTGHTYNVAQQQKAYEEEIALRWYAQAQSLSITDSRELRDRDIVTKQSYPNSFRGKVLRIERKVRDENGILQRKTVVVKDPRVINAYLRRYEKKQREENELLEEIVPENVELTNDDETNQLNKKLLQEKLARLEKAQERRAQRKALKEGGPLSSAGRGGRGTTRHCNTCGQPGHIRTNKACPMYYERGPGASENIHTGAMSTPAMAQTPTNSTPFV